MRTGPIPTAQSEVSGHSDQIAAANHTKKLHASGTETCETSPEECHLDQVCGVSEEESCPDCYCAPGYSGEECTSKQL